MPKAEQEYWLRKAEQLSWSRNQLRREVRASLRDRGQAYESGEDVENRELGEEETANCATADAEPKAVDRLGLTLEVSFSREQLDICQAAASISGISLENWALRTLKEAAKDTLDQADLQ